MIWVIVTNLKPHSRKESHPLKVDEAANNWDREQGNFRQCRFLKSSYARLEAEYQQLNSSEPGDDAIKAWADKIHKETMELMIEANRLDSWSKRQTNLVQATKAKDWRQTRIDYFETRAQEMTPPMPSNLLWKMAAFKGVLKVRSEGTQRSWDELRKKIENYRSHAEQVEEFDLLMSFPDSNPQFKLFRQLHEHRCGRKGAQRTLQPEQKFVLRLGQAAFTRCVARGVADEDLLLLTLKNVFDSYSTGKDLPTGLNFDGTTGLYRLSLDDARMIVEDVIEKQVARNSPRGRVVFQSLRCRGCRRTDHIRTWSFVEAFEHILKSHGREVGEGLEYYQFAKPYCKVYNYWSSPEEGRVEFKFPWYTTHWPRSLPLVPRHQDTSKLPAWHPVVPTEFVQLKRLPGTSAFEGRQPCKTDNPDDDFALNLIYAAKNLHGLWLDGPCQMKIALRFAYDLYMKQHTTEPALSKFMTCLDGLRAANPAIELKFGCGICVGEEKVHRSARQGKYKKAVDNLEKHWTSKHHSGSVSWTEGLMQLPSESEVLQQILAADEKLQEEKVALNEREMALSTNIKKRANLKRNVVLEQRAAGEVFDELFPRID